MGSSKSFDASIVVESDLQGTEFNTEFKIVAMSSKTYLNEG